ncbi:copper amine oxidase N-terminal domain-containing protein [Paenibacillus sp. FSL H7-0350]|uniref:copper amine oxidase N-terminal domain-containing protein n=1 Tax=Paenibacillus sp. FSL H7-0350 TaxID=2975345 RepID=UPI0031580A36
MITFKKLMQIIGISILVTSVAHSPAPAVAASGTTQSATAGAPAIQVYLNKEQITSTAGGATLINNTVMLSLDKLYVRGATITYDEHSRMLTIQNLLTQGSMKIGSTHASVNGKQITYSAAFQQVNKQLYIPLRFVNDAIGGSLEWDAVHREAYISYPEFAGEGLTNKNAYFLNGVDGTLYKRDITGKVHTVGASTAKLDPYYIAGTRITAEKISDDADLVTIQYSSGEPSINLTVYNLFVRKGVILRQSKANYWQFSPEDIKIYEGNAVMNDGHSVRLIAPDGSVKQIWNHSKLAGTPEATYTIEGISGSILIVRSSQDGILTLIDTVAKQAVVLYEEFGIDPTELAGFTYDGIQFTGVSADRSELQFMFTNNKKASSVFTYRLET